MKEVKKVTLQESKVREMIEFIDHDGIDHGYFSESHLEDIVHYSSIDSLGLIGLSEGSFEGLPHGKITANTTLTAYIETKTLPTMMQATEAYNAFDVKKELADRIKKSIAALPNSASDFDLMALNQPFALWSPLLLKTYIWLLVALKATVEKGKLMTEEESMDYVLKETIRALKEDSDEYDECDE